MEITEVRVTLANASELPAPRSKVLAYCSLTFDDCFAVKDVRLIQTEKGIVVAFPDRKLTDRCPSCRLKSYLTDAYCGNCGVELPPMPNSESLRRSDFYADIAHPINHECRDMINREVIAAYHGKLQSEREYHATSA